MKNNVEERLEDLTRNLMKSANVEETSYDFTQNVMKQIENSSSAVSEQKPLIGRFGWLMISTLVMAIVYFSGLESESYNFGLLDKIQIDEFLKFNWRIPEVNISKITIYGLLLFCIVFVIQIPMLTKYYSKSIES